MAAPIVGENSISGCQTREHGNALRVERIDTFVCARTARISAEKCTATRRVRAGRRLAHRRGSRLQISGPGDGRFRSGRSIFCGNRSDSSFVYTNRTTSSLLSSRKMARRFKIKLKANAELPSTAWSARDNCAQIRGAGPFASDESLAKSAVLYLARHFAGGAGLFLDMVVTT